MKTKKKEDFGWVFGAVAMMAGLCEMIVSSLRDLSSPVEHRRLSGWAFIVCSGVLMLLILVVSVVQFRKQHVRAA